MRRCVSSPRVWRRIRGLSLSLTLTTFVALPTSTLGAGQVEDGDRIAAGRRLYREGILLSGEPVTALVQGGVPVDGTQFTCVSCHRRSGWGAIEGQTIVLPATGPALFAPREMSYQKRPAYTAESLARALREGVNAADRPLDPLMPRYRLPEPDMAALIAYLKTLAVEPAPGVTPTDIHFATVITEDVDPLLRRAMMDVFRTYFREKNGQSRHEVRRAESGPFYRDYRNKAYRRWILNPWLLKGPAETWPSQLEAYYEEQPVFALLSGISSVDWQPIHEFCEKHEIPSILPNTDRPYISEDGYYTLYFSEGMSLEGQVAAAHLIQQASRQKILQVFRENRAGSVAAAALQKAVNGRDDVSVIDWPLPVARELTTEELARRRRDIGAGATILWLPREELDALGSEPFTAMGSERLYLSSTLLGGDLAAVPDGLRNVALVIHPYTLGNDREQRLVRVGGWLRSRKIPVIDERIQAQTFFACLMAGEGLTHIKRYFSRDYFVDSIDHAERMAVYAAYYPSLSFGPGQRYLAKGAYIVDLRAGSDEALPERASWVVPWKGSR